MTVRVGPVVAVIRTRVVAQREAAVVETAAVVASVIESATIEAAVIEAAAVAAAVEAPAVAPAPMSQFRVDVAVESERLRVGLHEVGLRRAGASKQDDVLRLGRTAGKQQPNRSETGRQEA